MTKQVSPLFDQFKEFVMAAKKADEEGRHGEYLSNMLAAAYTAGLHPSSSARKSSQTIVDLILPLYQHVHDVDTTGLRMPEGWKAKIRKALEAEAAGNEAVRNLMKMRAAAPTVH